MVFGDAAIATSIQGNVPGSWQQIGKKLIFNKVIHITHSPNCKQAACAVSHNLRHPFFILCFPFSSWEFPWYFTRLDYSPENTHPHMQPRQEKIIEWIQNLEQQTQVSHHIITRFRNVCWKWVVLEYYHSRNEHQRTRLVMFSQNCYKEWNKHYASLPTWHHYPLHSQGKTNFDHPDIFVPIVDSCETNFKR